MSDNNLGSEKLRDAVYSYKSPEVTAHLYEFGKLLLDEMMERGEKINSQAVTILGWATGVIAFLFAQIAQFSGGSVYFALTSSVLALVAIFYAFQALKTRPNWEWPSDKSWINKSALGSEDEIKRFHIRVIHDVRQNHLSITGDKADCLFWSEFFLLFAALSLFGGIVFNILLTRFPGVLAFS
jgi:hypothetical protein